MWLSFALVLSSVALGADPGVLNLGKAGQATFEIVEANDAATVKIKLPDGSVQSLAGLGEHVQFLQKEGRTGKIATQDFDGDGVPEFVLRVTVPPRASHVFVYRYDSELKKFRSLPFADEDRLVADYNEPVEVLPDGIAFEMQEWEDEFKTGNPTRTRTVWKFRVSRFLPF